jgi:hypothetical protein
MLKKASSLKKGLLRQQQIQAVEAQKALPTTQRLVSATAASSAGDESTKLASQFQYASINSPQDQSSNDQMDQANLASPAAPSNNQAAKTVTTKIITVNSSTSNNRQPSKAPAPAKPLDDSFDMLE